MRWRLLQVHTYFYRVTERRLNSISECLFVLCRQRDDTIIVIVVIAIVRDNAALFLVRVMGGQDNVVNLKAIIRLQMLR